MLTEVAVRRWTLPLLALLVVAAPVLFVRGDIPCDLLSAQPACEVALRPGPTRDTSTLVEVDPELANDVGRLLITTVAVEDDLDLASWLAARRSRVVEAVPRHELYPRDLDPQQVTEHNAALMADSQITATRAALTALGHDLQGEGARIAAVEADAVTDAFEPGEVIVAVGGRRVRDSQQAVDAVQAAAPGQSIEFEVVDADGATRTVEVELGAAEDDPDRAYVGVILVTEIQLPVQVSIDAGAIGGPSAGLMFALAIVDQLTPGDLGGGEVVAGSGAVDPTGRVLAVGGIPQKLAGATNPGDADHGPATVFLLPRGNLDAARATPVARDVLLVPVDDLGQALDALAALRDGRQPTGSTLLAGGR